MKPARRLNKMKDKVQTMPPGQRLIMCVAIAAGLTIFAGQFLPINQSHLRSFAQGGQVSLAPPFALTNHQADLETTLKDISAAPRLRTGVCVVEAKTGRYAQLNSKEPFAAASIIKLPILVSLLEAIDRGDIKPNSQLVIKSDLLTGGSGCLQWRPVGSKVTVREATELMIIISDNTATNLLIEALGGKDKLNQEFARLGLAQTKINNLLGDFEGTNKTSPYDLVYLLGRVDRGELISQPSRQWMFNILERTRVRTLLLGGLPPGTKVAHKTGDIAGMIGDAGIVTTTQGVRYLVAVQVERPTNDRRANELIRNISKEVYQHFMM